MAGSLILRDGSQNRPPRWDLESREKMALVVECHNWDG